MKKSCIVIPCFNEANRFKADEFLEFIHSVEDVDLCFVNDGSKDQTLEKLREIKGRSSERIEVVSYPDNRGKAEAVREGFLKLVALKKYDWIAFADADLVNELRAAGLRVVGWGVFNDELGLHLARTGVDAMTCNHAVALREKYRKICAQ